MSAIVFLGDLDNCQGNYYKWLLYFKVQAFITQINLSQYLLDNILNTMAIRYMSERRCTLCTVLCCVFVMECCYWDWTTSLLSSLQQSILTACKKVLQRLASTNGTEILKQSALNQASVFKLIILLCTIRVPIKLPWYAICSICLTPNMEGRLIIRFRLAEFDGILWTREGHLCIPLWGIGGT